MKFNWNSQNIIRKYKRLTIKQKDYRTRYRYSKTFLITMSTTNKHSIEKINLHRRSYSMMVVLIVFQIERKIMMNLQMTTTLQTLFYWTINSMNLQLLYQNSISFKFSRLNSNVIAKVPSTTNYHIKLLKEISKTK